MALSARGFTLPSGKTPTPKNLNEYLIQNQGYRCDNGDCNNLVLSKPDELTSGYFQLVGEWGGKCCGGDVAKPSLEMMRELVNSSSTNIVIVAHVRNSSHFVLLMSPSIHDESSFMVLDPYYDVNSYSYHDISDVIIYSVIPSEAYVPKPYRLFKQYDYRWKDDVIEHKTVGEVGCLMSSTSMALNGHGIDLNPQSLNQWLRNHGGYTDQDDMEESVIPEIDPDHVSWNETIGMHTSNDLSLDSILESLAMGEPVIANVMHGRHFVLVVGVTSNTKNTTLYVNDPGFYRNTYDYEKDVVGWRLFNMTQVLSIP